MLETSPVPAISASSPETSVQATEPINRSR